MPRLVNLVIIDTRDLEPPEPLERVLAAVHDLAPQSVICMKHRRDPCLLYPILDKLGFTHHIQCQTEDSYEIFIWRKEDTALRLDLLANGMLGHK